MSSDPPDGAPPIPEAIQFYGDVDGHVVQARDIHGGVHLHPRSHRVPIPSQLPATGALVDRDEALAALDTAYGTVPVAVVSGPPGVGKSAVAVHWARQARGDFPDGQLYTDLRAHSADEPAQPSEVLGQFIRALGIAPDRIPSELAERTALYRSLTAESRLVVVLDDALSAAQVRPLVPTSARSLAIVTSRFRLGGLLTGGAHGVPLDRLSAEAALDLLRQTLGDDRVAAEMTAATALT